MRLRDPSAPAPRATARSAGGGRGLSWPSPNCDDFVPVRTRRTAVPHPVPPDHDPYLPQSWLMWRALTVRFGDPAQPGRDSHVLLPLTFDLGPPDPAVGLRDGDRATRHVDPFDPGVRGGTVRVGRRRVHPEGAEREIVILTPHGARHQEQKSGEGAQDADPETAAGQLTHHRPSTDRRHG